MKEIEGYEDYAVTKCGKVYSKRAGKFLKPGCGGGGRYRSICLCVNGKAKGFMIHRLVALAYIENPFNKPQVNHIDGDRNNNHIDNLEWVTAKENIRHAISIGLIKPEWSKSTQFKVGFDSNRNDKSKLSEGQVIDIRARSKNGETYRSISKDYDINESGIRRCCRRQSYSNII